MNKYSFAILCIAIINFSGCTAIQVNHTENFNTKQLTHICIIQNPKVTIQGFTNTLERSFARYNIQTKTYPANSKPLFCDTTLTYTALRSWDIVTYLSYAQLNLIQNDRQVAQATFHLRNKGGLALNKWRSVDTKIDELVDQLLEKSLQH